MRKYTRKRKKSINWETPWNDTMTQTGSGTAMDTEWDGTTDRVTKNREKREKEIEKKRQKVEKAAYIGKCTIGVGPILKESINYFHKITGDYSIAEKMAAGEFLQGYLKFDEND